MVTVKYFASLRETVGRSEDKVQLSAPVTIAALWNMTNKHLALPTQTLVAVNQEYAHLHDTVHDGDEVAYFPPVTGG